MKRFRTTVVLCCALAPPAAALPPDPLEEMIAAERAFSSRSVEAGMKKAFLEFFAPEAISFEPTPGNAVERWKGRPDESLPLPVTLAWAPVYGALSGSAELGFLTGPYVVTDTTAAKRPPRHGVYFSVWRRPPAGGLPPVHAVTGGAWKVILDVGTSLPQALAPLDAPFTRAPMAGPRPEEPARACERVRAAEAALAKDAAAYRAALYPDARLYRPGVVRVGRDAVAAELGAFGALALEPASACEAARLGDLVVTYGPYAARGKTAEAAETGHFIRTWGHEKGGAYRLMFEVQHPLPRPAP